MARKSTDAIAAILKNFILFGRYEADMDKRINTLFGSRFRGEWRGYDVLITLARLTIFFIRGIFKRLFLGDSSGIVLIGKGVRILYSHNLFVGKNFIAEDHCEINCLAAKKIRIGDRVTIGKYAIIRPANMYGGDIGEGLHIGDNSNVGPYSYIGCSGYVEIGDNVMISPRVSIYAENHNYPLTSIPIKDQGVTRSFVKIEDDCWIAANSVILAGVTIGRGSVVAAGSVVTKDVPPYSIVAGVPAKVIKQRKKDSIRISSRKKSK
jgi:acetyltransferase-like isoleucine patch superfamily enzyme